MYGVELGVVAIEGYWQALKDLGWDDMNYAMIRAMKRLKWMPKPAELRGLAEEIPVEDRAERAFEEVCKALGRHGIYQSVNFDDHCINASIRSLGGWVRLGKQTVDEIQKWVRKDFVRVYTNFARNGVSTEAGAYLPGEFERINLADGHEAPELIQVKTGLPALKAMEGKDERRALHSNAGGDLVPAPAGTTGDLR